MISDGLGYNGWLASDYYWHGRAGAGVYQSGRGHMGTLSTSARCRAR